MAMKLIYAIYKHSRETLGISLKEYEECMQLYFNFATTFPDELAIKSNKTNLILDSHDKMQAIIAQQNLKLEDLWESKMQIAKKLSERKSTEREG